MNENRKLTSDVNAIITREPLYMWKNGVSVLIAADDVTKLLGDGWLLYSPEEIPTLVQEIKASASELLRNVDLFVSSLAANTLDTSGEYATMNACLADVVAQVGTLNTIALQAYPIKASGDTVKLTDAQGIERIVPANQADAYKDAFSKGTNAPAFVTIEHSTEEQQVQLDYVRQNGEVTETPHMSLARKTIFEYELPQYEAEGWVQVK